MRTEPLGVMIQLALLRVTPITAFLWEFGSNVEYLEPLGTPAGFARVVDFRHKDANRARMVHIWFNHPSNISPRLDPCSLGDFRCMAVDVTSQVHTVHAYLGINMLSVI